MSDGKQYCLRWNNFSDNILSSLESLRGDEDFVDVTIACEGQSLKAHKVVLSACSLYIKKLLKENPCAHPIIILKDVALTELRALLSFMYNGQVMVAEEQIPRLLRTAELLEIRGLTDLTSLDPSLSCTAAAASRASAVVERDHPPSHHEQQSAAACPPSKVHQGPPEPPWAPSQPQTAAQGEHPEESEEDEEYDSEDDDFEEEEAAALPDFPLDLNPKPLTAPLQGPRDLQVTPLDSGHGVPRAHPAKEEGKPYHPALPPAHAPHLAGELQEAPSTRAMLPAHGHKAADIAARVSQMEESLLPGDVLVIGETHITPARCVPRPLKPPPLDPPPPKQQCFGGEAGGEGRLNLEMSLRLQVQRKLEAERLRAMERLRHAEAAFTEMGAPMDCSPFPVLTNGVHAHENGSVNHREEAMQSLSAQQPPVPPPVPAAAVGPATIPLPLSPDLQLKMLMCRDFKKYTNMLLVAVFGREVLATHCLNGSKGSAKPRLDTEKVTRVIATVMEKFDVPASTVREAIRVKLNNEDKLKKRSKRAAANPLL